MILAIHKSNVIILYYYTNIIYFLKLVNILIMHKYHSEFLFTITFFRSEMSKLDTNLLCSLDKKAEVS